MHKVSLFSCDPSGLDSLECFYSSEVELYLREMCKGGSYFPRWLSWSDFLSGWHTGDELCSVLAGLLYLSALVCQHSALQDPPEHQLLHTLVD